MSGMPGGAVCCQQGTGPDELIPSEQLHVLSRRGCDATASGDAIRGGLGLGSARSNAKTSGG